ncbi:unnamed protein product [Allacma fusca]|uniref:Dipeptidyl peptidase 9 n=1 Tax=Allacma fusca TaxID=39272 RepID=A0A8J2MEK8_9HEXA|nr:unnamed protein product [Allacma fusca]
MRIGTVAINGTGLPDCEAVVGSIDEKMNQEGTSNEVEVVEKKKTWDELRDDVRNMRRRLWGLGFKLPHSFTFRKMTGKTRIYFMSSPPNSRENSLHAIDVPDQEELRRSPDYSYPWVQILSPGFQGSTPPSKEEQLMMERKRMTPTGISTYEFHEPSAKFIFTASSSIYEFIEMNSMAPLNPREISSPHTVGSRLNAEICPSYANLIAFVCNGDLWILNSVTGHEEQLTFTHKGLKVSEDPISSGLPSYIIQEEFNRFHGFWWQPVLIDGVYRILYEEVDESNVNIVTLSTLPGRDQEEYRFPFPGTPNATSSLRFVEFTLQDDRFCNIRKVDMFYSLDYYFSWAEYIVRAGWTPDGLYVWAQLLNRSQKRLELVLFPYVPVESFTLHHDDPKLHEILPSAPAYVIYSEVTNIWVNVNDMLTFLPCDEPNSVMFLWASEETGFRHIYIIKSELRPALTQPWFGHPSVALCLSPMVLAKIPITRGSWEVVNAQMALHYSLGFLFFIGLYDTPIERHLYAVSIHYPREIRRLTNLGYSYSASFNNDCSMVILTYSSTKETPVCQLFSIQYTSAQIGGIIFEPITYIVSRPMVMYPEIESVLVAPDICTYYQQDTGLILYAMIYRPFNFVPGKKYPTILNIYGGPEVQLVYNSFRGTGQFWLYLLVSQGYCVIAIDSRGSHHRGLEFESHIRNRLGTVELKDQVEVLLWLAQRHSFLDINRIGLYGWSYGGYLSLMGLANYPNLFKVAIAGAPVTSWELYDTGYTERYMELPESNPQGYKEGSVLSYIQQFPDEEDRLLIIHGLVDENVHFVHTSQFINAMIKAGKPYQLQLYPSERHSLRRIEASEHYETMLLSFLQRCL